MTQPSWIGILSRLLAGLTLLAFPVTPARAQQPVSPVKGFISVEAYELRKEFVLQFSAIAERIGAASVTAIDSGNRAGLEASIGEWLTGKCPVEVDGKAVTMDLDRVHFVRPDPEKGLVVEDRDSVPATEAIVGVVFAAALDGPPDTVRVRWEVFPPDGAEAVVESGVRNQRTARRLTPAESELIWKNEVGLAIPELLSLPPVPDPQFRQGWMIWVAAAALLIGLGRGVPAWKRGRKWEWAVWVFIAGGLFAAGHQTAPLTVTPVQADDISYALLRNIYHAFDYRRESDIYDTLAKSADGDLLTQIYLEIQRSLQVETQGGARVRVTDVDLRECVLKPNAEGNEPDRFVADCQWVAVGTVTHWGHTHDRVNRYHATMTITPVDGVWKLVGLELVNEERI
ncbi:MAG: hypothetical protein KDL87_12960 [Verrucomicrobiae bacterium]|nr:hypothetical protein [Verrucomicrobiae bacterium]